MTGWRYWTWTPEVHIRRACEVCTAARLCASAFLILIAMHASVGRLCSSGCSRVLYARAFTVERHPFSLCLQRGRLHRAKKSSLRAVTEDSVDDFELKSELSEQDGVDYYAVLGVSPNADADTIKKAYYAAMRDYHPDISYDDEATEFCIFLNDVYETLTDPDKRAAYDEIAGFTDTAINPFHDTSYPKDQVFVDEFTCIGCKNCCNVCPKSFGLEDMFGRARVFNQKGDVRDKLQEAIDTCPVSCIHWVTAPQLTLLESAMAKIERVSAYVLLMGCGGATDVFQEAIKAFEKRQAEMRSKRDAAKMGSWMEDLGFNFEPATASPEKDLKRRAAAAQAASSARRWRDYQRNMRDKETLSLPSPSDN